MRALVVLALVAAVVFAQLPTVCWQRGFNAPRGWDSYDAFPVQAGPYAFNESVLLETAAVLATYNSTGRFRYVIADEGWAENNWMRLLDAWARPVPNPLLFPSAAGGAGLGPLASKLESEFGLELGVWFIKGIPAEAVEMKLPIYGTQYTAADIYLPNKTCDWHRDIYLVNASHPAAAAYYDSIIQLFASWGITYIKVDCIFGENLDTPEIQLIANSVRAYGQTPNYKQMMLSLSPGTNANLAMGNTIGRLASLYRITDDLWDCWSSDQILECPQGTSIVNATLTLASWAPLMGQYMLGQMPMRSFPDPDMLALGRIGLGTAGPHLSFLSVPNLARFTYALWSITQSPIILGGDMRYIKEETPFLDALFSNTMLADLQSCSGTPTLALQIFQNETTGDGGVVVWTSPHGFITGAFYVGAFSFANNATASYTTNVTVPWSVLFGNNGVVFGAFPLMTVTDLFTQQAFDTPVEPTSTGSWSATVPANDAVVQLLMPLGIVH